MKSLSILGSTGSIGTQTLDIVRRDKSNFRISALTAGKNVSLMEKQAREFLPELICMADAVAARDLKERLADTRIKVISGEEGLIEAASCKGADMVVGAIVGIAGLAPVLAAINAGKDVALANKETLVTAGELVMKAAEDKGVSILPVDSEHNAVFQCLMCGKTPEKILLTASGGPFFGKTRKELSDIIPEAALKHPTWTMGAKVTIDSATLANKGLEVIEASHLFGVGAEKIEVLVHRQSIVHSMVEFEDGAVLAQLGTADMRTPISVALNYPERSRISGDRLNMLSVGPLTFEKPDTKTFKSLALAYDALRAGGTLPAVLNGANEEAVNMFLARKCGFLDIADMTEEAMKNHKIKKSPALGDIYAADAEAREFVRRLKWA